MLQHHLDIVMCIDLTGSMYLGVAMIKENIHTIFPNLNNKLIEYGKPPTNQLRIKFIGFRDFKMNLKNGRERVFMETDFFEINNKTIEGDNEFVYFINGETATTYLLRSILIGRKKDK